MIDYEDIDSESTLSVLDNSQGSGFVYLLADIPFNKVKSYYGRFDESLSVSSTRDFTLVAFLLGRITW